MGRGRLRIYLGAAPGVGKTYAMLNEGRRRKARGTDVVVAYVETHGRPSTQAQIGELEIVPRRLVTHRGMTIEEMDLDAVLARRPEVALVDELAHTNAPGSAHEKRWEDVHALLEAGIDVISTVNVQHLESLNDVIEEITDVRQRETLPDMVVREADQVELVDMTPEALRRRLAHGNVYAPDKVDAALANYFRPGNLAALRELALLWVADKVDDALQQYMADHGITGSWETRERVVVAVTGAPSGEHLIRRAARMAQRSHGDLVGVHVKAGEGLASGPTALLLEHQRLLSDMGGDYHEIVAPDIAQGLAGFARSVRATQLVLGSTRRSRWVELVHGSVINKVLRLAGDIDVHVISQPPDPSEARLPLLPRREASPLSPRRRAAGWAVGAAGLPLLTGVLYAVRDEVALPTTLLLYLLLVCTVAAVGGLRPAVTAAVAAALVSNWFFTEPYGTLTIADPENFLALVVFVVTGALVSLLVGQLARRSAEAVRARAEAEALAAVAGQLSVAADPLAATLAHVRIAFGQDAVALLRAAGGGAWTVECADGDHPPTSPETGTSTEIAPGLVLCLVPGGLGPDDDRLLDAFGARVADQLDRRALQALAEEAAAQGRADDLRTAILRAVSHDLRSPLASIKASATSLLQDDVAWSDDDRRQFARTIDEETDRLDRLVANLLDMSRIETGTVEATTGAVACEDVIAGALSTVSQPTDAVAVAVPDDLPPAVADGPLLERVVANLVGNALEHAPTGTPVQVEGAVVDDRVVIRVVDHGKGIDPHQRSRMFEPFQRLGDSGGTGVGLGLAVARGFTEAMGGHLDIDDTPGGGLTVTISLAPAAPGVTPAPVAHVAPPVAAPRTAP